MLANVTVEPGTRIMETGLGEKEAILLPLASNKFCYAAWVAVKLRLVIKSPRAVGVK